MEVIWHYMARYSLTHVYVHAEQFAGTNVQHVGFFCLTYHTTTLAKKIGVKATGEPLPPPPKIALSFCCLHPSSPRERGGERKGAFFVASSSSPARNRGQLLLRITYS